MAHVAVQRGLGGGTRIGFIGMGAIALATGIWDSYEGGEVILDLLLQAFAFNCLLLPVGLCALWRRRRTAAGNATLQWTGAAPRGFEVLSVPERGRGR